MRRIVVSVGIGLALAAFTAGLVMAQTDLPVIKEQSQGDVRYASGGVGLEERAAMDAMAKNFNLKLVFAVATREYLSDLKVAIQDPSGKTYLSTTTDGPWMLVKLRDGEYTIQVAMGDQKLVQRKKVGKGLQVVNFHFKP